MSDLNLHDEIFETTNTAGVGTAFSLLGAQTGYKSVRDEYADGDWVPFVVKQQKTSGGVLTGIDFVTCLGKLTYGTPDTLARTHILSSSNGGADVDFDAGTKDIFVAPAGAIVDWFIGRVESRTSARTLNITDCQLLLVFDTSGGAITQALPSGSSLFPGFRVGAVRVAGEAQLLVDTGSEDVAVGLTPTWFHWTGSKWVYEGGNSSDIDEDLLINGDGRINQRQKSNGADGDYVFDRHYVLGNSGPSGINVSQLTDIADGTPYMMRLTQQVSPSKYVGLAQVIESTNCKQYRGREVTLSIKHRLSSGNNIRIAILEWTGTPNSPTKDVVNNWGSGTYTAGNFFISSNLTVRAVSGAIASSGSLQIDSLTATLGSNFENLYVVVWTEGAEAQNVTLDVAWQLRLGGRQRDFDYRNVMEEWAICQWYLWRFQPGAASKSIGMGVARNTTRADFYIALPTRQRTAGTVSISSAGHFELLVNGSPITCSSLTNTNPAADGIAGIFDVASGLTAGDAVHLRSTSTSAYIQSDAEIGV